MKVTIVISIIFIVVGILIKHFKMYFLIAGLNTMSPKERAQYNLDKIGTLFRNTLVVMALAMMLGYMLAYLLKIPAIEPIAIALTVITGCIILIVKSNSKAYKRRE